MEVDRPPDYIQQAYNEVRGYDGSPSVHMWRTIAKPDKPL